MGHSILFHGQITGRKEKEGEKEAIVCLTTSWSVDETGGEQSITMSMWSQESCGGGEGKDIRK